MIQILTLILILSPDPDSDPVPDPVPDLNPDLRY